VNVEARRTSTFPTGKRTRNSSRSRLTSVSKFLSSVRRKEPSLSAEATICRDESRQKTSIFCLCGRCCMLGHVCEDLLVSGSKIECGVADMTKFLSERIDLCVYLLGVLGLSAEGIRCGSWT
jgi:hypothetical protein